MRDFDDKHRTFYAVLGVDKSATPEEIKASYRKLASVTHPDRGGKEGDMALLNRAYMVLQDEKLRAHYDEQIKLLSELCPSCAGSGRKWKQKGFHTRIPIVCDVCLGNGMLRWKQKPNESAVIVGPVNKRSR